MAQSPLFLIGCWTVTKAPTRVYHVACNPQHRPAAIMNHVNARQLKLRQHALPTQPRRRAAHFSGLPEGQCSTDLTVALYNAQGPEAGDACNIYCRFGVASISRAGAVRWRTPRCFPSDAGEDVLPQHINHYSLAVQLFHLAPKPLSLDSA